MTDLDERPEPIVPTSVSMPIAEFEGSYVRMMDGKLPPITLAMEEGYVRGTHLLLGLEVRVRNVRYEEDRKGDLTRVHIFALEEAKIHRAWDPAREVANVGGSLAGDVADEEDWEEILLAYLRGDVDELDFEGGEIPERLQQLLEAGSVPGGAREVPGDLPVAIEAGF